METIDAINKKIALLKDKLQNVKGRETKVYSRITGYYRPVKRWNPGKREEFRKRKYFKVKG
ncbi:MAG: hypothetical protein JXB88_03260 [Spirochaetales bacterium]|nr:hypothetical protein [Spirochaetales bacterium]